MKFNDKHRKFIETNRRTLKEIFQIDYEKLKEALVLEESVEARAKAQYVKDWILLCDTLDPQNQPPNKEQKRQI